MKLPTLFLVYSVFLLLGACGGGSGSSQSSSNPTIPPVTTATQTPTPTPEPTQIPEQPVTISGTVTYDLVPYRSIGDGLDYNAMTEEPVRWATVHLMSESGAVLASTRTDESGDYAFIVESNTSYSIRVRAEMISTGGRPSWDFSIADNTNDNALYVMEGSLVSSGTTDSVRNLHADSGWTGTSYGNPRVAAPFAILDSIYIVLRLLLDADPNIALPVSEFRWSSKNIGTSLDNFEDGLVEGLIGSSFYYPSQNSVYILGTEDNDTDEYDRNIILHELTHYLEDTISRSDNIGGPHTFSDKLDMRLVFSEGLANALSAVLSDVDFYKDTGDARQGDGFTVNLESDRFGRSGWFNEATIGRIIYDFCDSEQDGDDSIDLDFSHIYDVLTADDYISHPSLLSIYTFSDELQNQNGSVSSNIRDIMTSEQIFGTGAFGEGETNDGGVSVALPVYHSLNVGGSVDVDTNNGEAGTNGLDVSRFIRVNISSGGEYTLRTETTGCSTGDRDPVMVVYRNGLTYSFINGSSGRIEEEAIVLEAGEYIVEVFDFENRTSTSGGGAACFTVSIN